MPKLMKLEAIESCIVPTIMLRTPDQAVIDEYSEAMKQGVEFPPVVLGINAKKKEEVVVVDGLHRIRAARQAGVKELAVTEKTYPTPDALLADMYFLNRHGSRVRPEDRDARIRLLTEKHAWTQAKVAKEFGLDQSSVSRILAGKQKAGQAKGEAKDRTKFKPLSGKSFLSTIKRAHRSLKNTTTIGDLVELCWTKEAEGVTEKQLKDGRYNLDLLKDFRDGLTAFFEHLEKEERKG